MQTLILGIAVITVFVTIWALVKRYEARLVLFVAGLFMALISLRPMMAFQQFDKSMTNPNLIIAICSAMGFAAVIKLTGCDVHLVSLLTKPLKKVGVFLLPACGFVTALITIAIPSTAGCAAAVAPTMIPLLVRAGFHPAAGAAIIIGGITVTPNLNPGLSHNAFLAKMADIDVMDFIAMNVDRIVVVAICSVIFVTLTCLFYRDYNKNQTEEEIQAKLALADSSVDSALPEHPNLLKALAPVLPMILLVICSIWFKSLRMSVATSMLIGTIYCFVVTRADPSEISKKFFDGMGSGYAKIMGIIIAAGVFAAGLRAAGVVDLLVEYLKNAQEIAKLGGSLGPFILGVIVGSGDAAAFAFNEAVTPHAAEFGTTIPALGFLASAAGSLGRQASPICGGLILAAGIAGVSPVEVARRTAPGMVLSLVVLYLMS